MNIYIQTCTDLNMTFDLLLEIETWICIGFTVRNIERSSLYFSDKFMIKMTGNRTGSREGFMPLFPKGFKNNVYS